MFANRASRSIINDPKRPTSTHQRPYLYLFNLSQSMSAAPAERTVQHRRCRLGRSGHLCHRKTRATRTKLWSRRPTLQALSLNATTTKYASGFVSKQKPVRMHSAKDSSPVIMLQQPMRQQPMRLQLCTSSDHQCTYFTSAVTSTGMPKEGRTPCQLRVRCVAVVPSLWCPPGCSHLQLADHFAIQLYVHAPDTKNSPPTRF